MHHCTCITKITFMFLEMAGGRPALDTLFYTPDFGDLPDFDLPDELELPNIAEVAGCSIHLILMD